MWRKVFRPNQMIGNPNPLWSSPFPRAYVPLCVSVSWLSSNVYLGILGKGCPRNLTEMFSMTIAIRQPCNIPDISVDKITHSMHIPSTTVLQGVFVSLAALTPTPTYNPVVDKRYWGGRESSFNRQIIGDQVRPSQPVIAALKFLVPERLLCQHVQSNTVNLRCNIFYALYVECEMFYLIFFEYLYVY